MQRLELLALHDLLELAHSARDKVKVQQPGHRQRVGPVGRAAAADVTALQLNVLHHVAGGAAVNLTQLCRDRPIRRVSEVEKVVAVGAERIEHRRSFCVSRTRRHVGPLQPQVLEAVVLLQRVHQVARAGVADGVAVENKLLQDCVVYDSVGDHERRVGAHARVGEVQVQQAAVLGQHLSDASYTGVLEPVPAQVELLQAAALLKALAQQGRSFRADMVPRQVQVHQRLVGRQQRTKRRGALVAQVVVAEVQRVQHRVALPDRLCQRHASGLRDGAL
mmetsp:Transcript_40933/g.122195  ORF Transcript_40933/g.122195 Transcript_40933/m.122195 type:complete len:277 (-) Transcript_40933:2733-3563(-)